jgi:hypothetical protein
VYFRFPNIGLTFLICSVRACVCVCGGTGWNKPEPPGHLTLLRQRGEAPPVLLWNWIGHPDADLGIDPRPRCVLSGAFGLCVCVCVCVCVCEVEKHAGELRALPGLE